MKFIEKTIRRVSDSLLLQLIITGILTVLFGAFIYKTAPSKNIWWPGLTAGIFAVLFALGMLLIISQKRFNALELLGAAACLLCAMYARVLLIPYQSGDYSVYLFPWAKQLGELTVKEALSTPIGNYNLPYIYFLTLLSHLNIEIFVGIKAFSCLFDVILAWSVMKLAMTQTEDNRLVLGAFIAVLLSPTIMINGAMWSQCDAVFTAFCVISAYAAIKGRGRLCAISWTVAFCFKLQAVFILPALAVAFFMGKVKFKHLLWIPAVYFISILPALLAGRSFADCINVYSNQVGYYNGLFINSPTVWRLFGDAQIPELTNMAVYLALGVLMLFSLYALSVSKKMDDRQLVTLFFLSAFLAAYILPRMHERYFYLAEVFAIVYFVHDRRKWYVPVAITAASLTNYMEYFLVFNMSSAEEYAAKTVGINQVYVSIALLVILAIESREFFSGLWSKTENWALE